MRMRATVTDCGGIYATHIIAGVLRLSSGAFEPDRISG